MAANIDSVEHAITETLNGMQLHEPCIVQTELNELKQSDPGHFRENVQLYAKMTANYPGFPHLEIESAARAPDAPITCPETSHDCPVAPKEMPMPAAPQPQAEYISPPAAPQPQPEYIAPPAPPAMEMQQPQYYLPPQPDLGTNLLTGLATGLGEGLAIAAIREAWGRQRPYFYNYNAGFNSGINEGYEQLIAPPPPWAHPHRRPSW